MKTLKLNNLIKTTLIGGLLSFLLINPINISADENDLKESNSLSSTVKNFQIESKKNNSEKDESALLTGEHIRFSLGNLFPKEDFTSTLSVTMSEKSTSIKVDGKKDQKLIGEVLLPASIGSYDATLKDTLTGEIIFNIRGELEIENGTYIHQVKNINSEKNSLSIIEGEEGFNILIGYVEGGIMTEVELLDNKFEQCLAYMSLDSNADGIFSDGEIIQKAVNSSYSKLHGPQASRLPLTSNYEVIIKCDGFAVASNTGSYDLVNGEAINSKKSRSADVIGTFGVGFKRNLYVSSDSIMGEEIFPAKKNLSLTEKDGSDSWDTLSPRSSRDNQLQNEEVKNKSLVPNQESSISMGFIMDWFLDNPWTYLPASLVLAIVVIACFSTVAVIAQRKNQV